jgi:hypothetical protein
MTNRRSRIAIKNNRGPGHNGSSHFRKPMIGRDVESPCHGAGQRGDGTLAVGDDRAWNDLCVTERATPF